MQPRLQRPEPLADPCKPRAVAGGEPSDVRLQLTRRFGYALDGAADPRNCRHANAHLALAHDGQTAPEQVVAAPDLLRPGRPGFKPVERVQEPQELDLALCHRPDQILAQALRNVAVHAHEAQAGVGEAADEDSEGRHQQKIGDVDPAGGSHCTIRALRCHTHLALTLSLRSSGKSSRG
jgi:hypothetical protein